MTTFVPPVASPPHDSRWWLLQGDLHPDPASGWRLADPTRLQGVPDPCCLSLPHAERSLASLLDPTGTLGGRVLPRTVALEDGAFYAVDPRTLELKWFDRCACRFKVLARLGEPGDVEVDFCAEGVDSPVPVPETGVVRSAFGIGISRGNLFVVDPVGRRLAVLAVFGLVPRGFWSPPPGEGLVPWEPTDVAFDRWCRVFVADPANGCVHRFDRYGRWHTCFSGMGAVSRLVVDDADRLLVFTDHPETPVRITTLDGVTLERPETPELIARHLPPTPFPVDARGHLFLSDWCASGATSSMGGVFDASGNPASAARRPPRLQAEAEFVFGPLDSGIYRCTWHRVELSGSLPSNARVAVSTATSEAEEPVELVSDWTAVGTSTVMPNGSWDGLVRSGPGRYLWLRLVLRGDEVSTPRLRSIRVEYPRIKMGRYLPSVFAQDTESADFTDRFLAIFDTTFRGIERYADELPRYFDPDSAPAQRVGDASQDFLSWLGTWIGVALDSRMPVERRRRIVKSAARLHRVRGTREAFRRQLLVALGLDEVEQSYASSRAADRCTTGLSDCAPCGRPSPWPAPELLLEHYRLRRWLHVGSGTLNNESVLWGQRIANRSQLDSNARVGVTELKTWQDPLRDPFHHFAHRFSVFVPARYGRSARERSSIKRLVEAGKPAHTQYDLEFVEPRFRVGFQSSIGLDSVVGRYPEGVVLDETRLDRNVLLSGDRPTDAPTLEIGEASQVGTSTRLT